MRKKVCMVLGNPFTSDSRVYKEAQSLKNAGYDVTVYATFKNLLPLDEKVDGIIVKRRTHNYSPFRPKIWRYWRELLPTYRELVDEKADFYHAHNLDTLLIAYISAQKNKSKVIYDSHEVFLGTYTPYDQSYLLYVFGLLKKPFWSLLEKFLAPRVDATIVVNDFIKEYFVEKYNSRKIVSIMNTLPKQSFLKTQPRVFNEIFKLNKDTKIVLYQGGLAWKRGIRQLIEAVKYFSGNIVLVIMGDGEILPDIKSLTSQLKLEERVLFLPPVSYYDLPKYTGSADIGVIPTLNVCLNHYYSAPNKLFEYMGAGLAIVCSNLPFMKEVVEKNKLGITFDPTNPKDISNKINTLLNNQNTLEEMKDNSLKVAQEKYNWEIEEKKLLDLYEHI